MYFGFLLPLAAGDADACLRDVGRQHVGAVAAAELIQPWTDSRRQIAGLESSAVHVQRQGSRPSGTSH